MSELNDNGIEKIFTDHFKDFEVDVDPSVWSSVSKNIPSTNVGGGMSLLSKIIVGVSAATIVAVGTVLVVNNDKENVLLTAQEELAPKEQTQEHKELPVETPVIAEKNDSNLIVKGEVYQDQEREINADFTDDSNTILEEKRTNINIGERIIVQYDPSTVVEKEEQKVDVHVEEKTELTQTNTKEETFVEENIVETRPTETTIVQSEVELTIPNVITPNNDGDNDVYFITSEGLQNFSFIILDNQQKLVFETSQPDFNWYGNAMNGDMVDNGEYFYILIAEDKTGKSIKKAGKITVRR